MRLGKIARLPKPIREQLNRRLDSGQVGRTILKWLNDLPETKQVLAELFEAKPITHQNLSEWRLGGYQDWLQHQHCMEWFSRLTENNADLLKLDDRCPDTHEAFGRLLFFEIGQAFAAMQNIKDPDARFARLEHLTDKFTQLQNAFNWSRHVDLSWTKYNDSLPPQRRPALKPAPEQRAPDRPVPQLPNSKLLNSQTEIPAQPETPSQPGLRPDHSKPAPLDTRPSPLATTLDRSNVNLETPPPITNATPNPQPETQPPTPPATPVRSESAFAPIPTISTTTPPTELVNPPSSTPNPPFPPPPPPPYRVSSLPIRGRRFRCIEG